MLTAHKITKRYNIEPLLDGVSFSINSADRVGLIGPNGSGKTTLLQILAGLEPPDSGIVTLNPPDLRIGYLSQGFEWGPEETLEDILSKSIGNPRQSESEIERLASALAVEPDREDLQIAYTAAIERLESLPFTEIRPEEVLEQLGLQSIPKSKPASELSGGQRTRLALAAVLVSDPDLLLLDEPTNHLDIAALEWLESWLASFSGAALVVSHDRTFLDHIVERIFELDSDMQVFREYTGNYSAYLEQHLRQQQKQSSAYRDQVYEISRMKQDIARTKQHALRVELTTTSRQPGVRRYAKKVARKAKSREKKLERYLDSDQRIEKPRQSWQMDLRFNKSGHTSQVILSMEGLSIGYPPQAPLLQNFTGYIQGGERIVLTGQNGGGKTTLIKTILGELPPLSGLVRLGENVQFGYMSQDQGDLPFTLSPLQILQSNAALGETEARAFLHRFLFTGDEALRPVNNLSYGERSRLLLATLVVQGCNFLILDEPINHLDIPSRSRFEQALSEYEGTILAVVHDRYFIQRFATGLWILENHKLTRIS